MFIFWYVLSCLHSLLSYVGSAFSYLLACLSYLLSYLDFIIVPINALINYIGAYIGGLIDGLVEWLAHVTQGMTPEHAALAYGFTTGMVAGLPLGGMALLSATKVGQGQYRNALIIIIAVTIGDLMVAAMSMAMLHLLFKEIPEWLRQIGSVVLVWAAYRIWKHAKIETPQKSAKEDRFFFWTAFIATVWHPGSWTTYLTAYGVLLPKFGMLPIREMGWGETFLQLVANTLGLLVMTYLFLGIVWLVFHGIRLARRWFPQESGDSQAGVVSGFLNRFSVGRWLVQTWDRVVGVHWGMVMNRATSVVMVCGAVALLKFKT